MLDVEKDYEKDKQPGDTDTAQMWCDVGIWGVPGPVLRQEVWDGVEATMNMEDWLRKNKSYQCLYAVVEQTEAQFWNMFDPTLYNAVREKWVTTPVPLNPDCVISFCWWCGRAGG